MNNCILRTFQEAHAGACSLAVESRKLFTKEQPVPRIALDRLGSDSVLRFPAPAERPDQVGDRGALGA
jgi:hypothetical protein